MYFFKYHGATVWNQAEATIAGWYFLEGEIFVPVLKLDTRSLNQIENECDTNPLIAGMRQQAEDLRKEYLSAIHRPTQPCNTYNCHGLTFASRRTQISNSAEVRKILKDDGYEQIDPKLILPGDVVLYINTINASIDHSGVVVDVQPNMAVMNPKILSKWGNAHEVIHYVRDCPYPNTRLEYYRLTR